MIVEVILLFDGKSVKIEGKGGGKETVEYYKFKVAFNLKKKIPISLSISRDLSKEINIYLPPPLCQSPSCWSP